MANECCSSSEILIFACSGASNVGQVANQAAVDLQLDDFAKMLCLAGIGGHVSGMIASAKAGKRLVGIDGCPVACTKKTMEHAELPLTDHVIVTDLGFKKAPYSGQLDQEALNTVKKAVRDKISAACADESSEKADGKGGSKR